MKVTKLKLFLKPFVKFSKSFKAIDFIISLTKKFPKIKETKLAKIDVKNNSKINCSIIFALLMPIDKKIAIS